MKKLRIPLVIVILSVVLSSFFLPDFAPLDPQYLSPIIGAQYVNPAATIIVRYGIPLTASIAAGLNFTVQGSQSGFHAGTSVLADDQKTVIFTPDKPFAAGEHVKFRISNLALTFWRSYHEIFGEFSVSIGSNLDPSTVVTMPIPSTRPPSAFPADLTVPQDIPQYSVFISADKPHAGYIFLSPFYWTSSTVGSYLLILDSQGKLVYYKSMAAALTAYDFVVQPDGLLSYYNQKDATYYLMNSHYETVGSYQAGDGYTADTHDFLLGSNGYAFLLAQDFEGIDMSKVVPGGQKAATVEGVVIQELDPHQHVIFEWRNWDHFALTDSDVSLSDQDIDLIHANSLCLSSDGNLLLSSRNLSEITKIDLKTGAILWRMGGKANQFTFTNDQGFAYQHDVRQLANGDLTLFDNHGVQTAPTASRAVEYSLDELHKTVTRVWEYSSEPPVFSSFMGSLQRLADGTSVIGWGAAFDSEGYDFISLTELNARNQVELRLAFTVPYVSYRAYLLPWQGTPNTLPDLAYKLSDGAITLGYSWNGATGVSSYNVYGGNEADKLMLIDEKKKTDFETQSRLSGPVAADCYYQVAALNSLGAEMARSKVISINGNGCKS